ncbi:hypothetical protein LDL08_16750 [Nonomuraea glycinis]|uniref:Uncharacterized protein n=1 Tax=Nonomuraea glycinis TaxID=2047744 RepID=A0A918A7C3_9ACTN|nr:hypothetical protein [Nonomuraea glycinis]MCA2177841.1 hypothetical protein [Nonomuraea glycinis]GGP06586.1 hypothetical protein GCM10012278_30800 [Nonomuraea glycinis]
MCGRTEWTLSGRRNPERIITGEGRGAFPAIAEELPELRKVRSDLRTDHSQLDWLLGNLQKLLVPNVRVRYLERGRVGYWDPGKRAVVIEDGNGGTVFTPMGGETWFDEVLR